MATAEEASTSSAAAAAAAAATAASAASTAQSPTAVTEATTLSYQDIDGKEVHTSLEDLFRNNDGGIVRNASLHEGAATASATGEFAAGDVGFNNGDDYQASLEAIFGDSDTDFAKNIVSAFANRDANDVETELSCWLKQQSKQNQQPQQQQQQHPFSSNQEYSLDASSSSLWGLRASQSAADATNQDQNNPFNLHQNSSGDGQRNDTIAAAAAAYNATAAAAASSEHNLLQMHQAAAAAALHPTYPFMSMAAAAASRYPQPQYTPLVNHSYAAAASLRNDDCETASQASAKSSKDLSFDSGSIKQDPDSSSVVGVPGTSRHYPTPHHSLHQHHAMSVSPTPSTAEQQAARARHSRDERKARELGISFSIDDIINLPMDEFNDLLSKHDLTEEQLNLCRDIRRRGKNKVAAQNCRKRKIDQIQHLQQQVDEARMRKTMLMSERDQLYRQREEWASMLNSMEADILNGMRKNAEEFRLDFAAEDVRVLPRRGAGAEASAAAGSASHTQTASFGSAASAAAGGPSSSYQFFWKGGSSSSSGTKQA